MKDYAKIGDDGKPMMDKDGNYTPDIEKIKTGGFQAMNMADLRDKAIDAFKNGDKEAYDHISNLIHFDYMMPWLQIEGGADLLRQHIKSMANVEHEKDLEQ